MSYVFTHTHGEGKIGVIVEFECSDEATFRTEQFRAFALDTALQIVANSPLVVAPNQLAEVVPLDRGVAYERPRMSQALLEQPFVKDSSFRFGDVLRQLESQLGVMIHIRRFTRYGPNPA